LPQGNTGFGDFTGQKIKILITPQWERATVAYISPIQTQAQAKDEFGSIFYSDMSDYPTFRV
jgi:hypothetical protein